MPYNDKELQRQLDAKTLKWGFINRNNEWVIEPIFYKVSNFKNNVALAAILKDEEARKTYDGQNNPLLWGVIDKSGKWKIQPQFDRIEEFAGNVLLVKNGSYRGLINLEGEWLVEIEKKLKTFNFKDGYITYSYNNEAGLLDYEGKWIIPFGEYADIIILGEGLFGLKKEVDGLYAIADKDGNFITQPTFRDLTHYSEGLCVFLGPHRKIGFINLKGEVVIEPIFDSASNFKEGIAPAAKDSGKTGFIDYTGKWVIEPIFDGASSFSEGLAEIREGFGNSKSGYINKQGEIIIKPKYPYAEAFHGGMAIVETPRDTFTFVNMKGKALKERFDWAYDFDKNGFAVVRWSRGRCPNTNIRQYDYALIDNKGNYVVEPVLDLELSESYEWFWTKFKLAKEEDMEMLESQSKDLQIVLMNDNNELVYFKGKKFDEIKKFKKENPSFSIIRYSSIPVVKK